MYLSQNPRIRFVAPRRAGLGDSAFSQALQKVGSVLTLEPIVGPWTVSGVFYDALAAARDAVYRVGGVLSPGEKQQIDAANQAAIAHAAGVSNPNVPHSPALDAQYQAAAQQAIQKYRDEVAVVYAQASGEATRANVPKYLLLAAAGLGIYLVASR